jgi:hypothetical protein
LETSFFHARTCENQQFGEAATTGKNGESPAGVPRGLFGHWLRDAVCERRWIARKTHYSWLKSDVAYAASFERSKRAARDYHVDYSIYDAVRRYDDRLLMRLLRKMQPQKYGVRR